MEISRELEGLDRELFELESVKFRLSLMEKDRNLSPTNAMELKRVRKRLRDLQKTKIDFIDAKRRNGLAEHVFSKSFGEADEGWIILVTGIDAEYHEWTSYIEGLDEAVTPSTRFRMNFDEIAKFYHLEYKAGRRVYINTFLVDIVRRPEFKNALRIFQETEISTESNGRRLIGKADFSIGLGTGSNVFGIAPSLKYRFITVEANKLQLDESDFVQCLSVAATLFKSLKDAGEVEFSVFGVLSNAFHWIFMLIDKDGKLWKSKIYAINLIRYEEEEVLFVYRFLHYIIKCCFESAVQTMNTDSNISIA